MKELTKKITAFLFSFPFFGLNIYFKKKKEFDISSLGRFVERAAAASLDPSQRFIQPPNC